MTAPSTKAGVGGLPPPSSIDRAAALALSTSGWSNGLIPISRPATAVAYSHSSICAPSVASTDTPNPEAGRTESNTKSGPTVHSTSSGLLGWKFGASRPSTTTGRMPLPSLPVDSATSCSAQSPKPGYGAPASAMTSLSTPARLATPSRAPSRRPGLSTESASRAGRIASASSSSAAMSAPASPLGTSPNAVRAENRPPTVGSARKTR